METYIRKGLEAQKEKNNGETYKIGDYRIMDVNWGQYTEKRPGEIYKGQEKAGKPLNDEGKKEIHNGYTLQFSLVIVVIDNIKNELSTCDSGVQISDSHSKPHKALKKSIQSISGKQWDMEQVQVPQQDEGESCGYRMLSNLSKVIKGQKNTVGKG